MEEGQTMKRKFHTICPFSFPNSMQSDIDYSVDMAAKEGMSHSEWISRLIREKVEAHRKLTLSAVAVVDEIQEQEQQKKKRPTYDLLAEPLKLYDEWLSSCYTMDQVEAIERDLMNLASQTAAIRK